MNAPRLGAYALSLADEDLTPVEVLRLAHDAGLGAVLFPTAFSLSPDLDEAELAEVRDHGTDLGVEVVAGFPNLHPHRLDDSVALLRAGDGDALRGFARLAAATDAFGVADVPVIIGLIEDRYARLVPWHRQLDAFVALTGVLRPILADHNLRLAVKTHEEISTYDVVRLVERCGEDLITVGFDPVNVLVNLEDPVAAAARVAPYTRHVYVDDALFAAAAGGADRLLCPVGDGLVDWPVVTDLIPPAGRTVRYWIELHRGQFQVHPFDPEWMTNHPDLSVAEYATTVRAMSATPDQQALRVLQASQARPTSRLGRALEACERLGLREAATAPA
ncbi:sugar phosphate isomerase/epimerase family protein [Kribbella sp. NPDC059898]|uniref:sugar phosphate isomerase/epimerase family protein n=1 Tax=Kribbella sp. NPDC059898 TaxID=3346995 RepID=UPI0036683472